MSSETQQITVVPPGASYVEKGEPTYVLSTTSNYEKVWNDRGSGAHFDVTVWRPKPLVGEFILGDYAQPNHAPSYGSSLTIKAINDDMQNPILKPPVTYVEMWNDKGSGGDYDFGVWWPKPPENYVSLGFVGSVGYGKQPQIPTFMCVRADLVQEAPPPIEFIWSSFRVRGANKPKVTLWKLPGLLGAFTAVPNEAPIYSGPTVFRLRNLNV